MRQATTHREDAMKRELIWWIAVAALAFAGAGAFWWQHSRSSLRPAAGAPALAEATPPTVTSAPAEPSIRYPIEAAVPASAAPASARALPPLGQADAFVTDALIALLGRKAVLSQLSVDHFVGRVVATVDNLDRSHAPARQWPVNPMPGRFVVAEGGLIGADNAARYAPFVQWVETIDTGKAAALYVRLYPLFQSAYEELGYPRRYFNDRLVAVIDHLLQTPELSAPVKVKLTEVKGPLESTAPWTRYEFDDPALEARSAGQKMLLRTGDANARRLKVKLAEWRRQITGAKVPR
jgi:hypothetical protein